METLFSLIITVVILSLVAALFYYGTQDPIIELTDDFIKIKGGVFYSVHFELKNISKLETVSVLPKITLRTNGFSTFRSLRGHFWSKELGKTVLFVFTKSSPFIYFELNTGKKIFLNFVNPEDTIACYNAIQNKLKWK